MRPMYCIDTFKVPIQLDDVLRNGDISSYQVYRGCLKMDGQTLVNLEIFSNNADGGPSGKCLPLVGECSLCNAYIIITIVIYFFF